MKKIIKRLLGVILSMTILAGIGNIVPLNASANSENLLYEQVTLNFYDGQNNLVSSVVRDIPDGKTTLGSLLNEEYPVATADLQLGEFQGWISEYNDGMLFDRDKEITFGSYRYNYSSNSYNFYAGYEKRYLDISYCFLTEEGKWKEYTEKMICKVGMTSSDIISNLVSMDNSIYKFQGWLNISNIWNDELPDVIDYKSGETVRVEGLYERYPVTVSKKYIDRDGKVKNTKEELVFEQGTTYDILLASCSIPEDASEIYQISGWNVQDPNGIIAESFALHNGKIGSMWESGIVEKNYFNVIADYSNCSLVDIDYGYVDRMANWVSERKTIICKEKATSKDIIYKYGIENAPSNHLEALEFDGTWTMSEQHNIFSANYKRIPVCIQYQKNGKLLEQIYAAEPNQVLQLPDGYSGAESYKDKNGIVSTKYYDEMITISSFSNSYYIFCQEDKIETLGEFVKQLKGIPLKSEKTEDIVEQIENSSDGSEIEIALDENSATLSGSILEALQGKKLKLNIDLASDIKWNILGTNLPEGTLTDIDLSVTRKDKENGNIAESVIDELAGNRTAEQLIFGTNEDVTFKPQLALTVNSDNTAEKGVLLQKSGDALMLAANSLIKDNAVAFTLNQKADSVIVYGTNGDIDGDNKVKIKDAMQILQHTNSRKAMNELQKGFADTDSNNKVNLQDVMREMHYISGRNKVVY